MKDPQRLLDGGANGLELRLLEAGCAEGPSLRARRAAAVALGLSAALATSSVAAAVGTQSLAPAAKLFAAKWWLIAALASAGAGAGYIALAPRAVTGSAEASATPSAQAPAEVARSPQAPTEARVTPAEPEGIALAEPTPEPARVSAPRGVAGAPTAIQHQIALIDRARSAAASGHTGATLAALDEYQRRFPRGVLKQEAAMLRIEALLARGDEATATRLGKDFLKRYPRSALAARVKSLLED